MRRLDFSRRPNLRRVLSVAPFLLLLWLVGCANPAAPTAAPAEEVVAATGKTEAQPSPEATATSAPRTPPTEPADTDVPTAEPEPKATSDPTRTPIPEGALVDVNTLEDFSTLFDEEQGQTRLLLFLSTGCSSCLAGARWLEEVVLAPNPELELRVYALWFPMLPAEMLPPELSGLRDESVLNDPRVVHLWDRQRAVNEWFAENAAPEGPERASLRRTYGDLTWGTVIWDTYVLYGPDATWAEAGEAAEAAAYPILTHRASIREALDLSKPDVVAEAGEGATRYRIVPEQSFVTYRVAETFAGRNFNYAIGVTNNISGEIELDPDNPAASEVGPIEVAIRDFRSDNFLRDERIQNEFLESARFPVATFMPTAVRGLPETYTPGETVAFEIVGDLVVRETSVPATFGVTAELVNGRLTGTATTQVLMTDFGFDPPAIADLIAAENEVDITFEFLAVPVGES